MPNLAVPLLPITESLPIGVATGMDVVVIRSSLPKPSITFPDDVGAAGVTLRLGGDMHQHLMHPDSRVPGYTTRPTARKQPEALQQRIIARSRSAVASQRHVG